jgi:hypothetical protein
MRTSRLAMGKESALTQVSVTAQRHSRCVYGPTGGTEKKQMSARRWSEKLMGRYHLEDQGVDAQMIQGP